MLCRRVNATVEPLLDLPGDENGERNDAGVAFAALMAKAYWRPR